MIDIWQPRWKDRKVLIACYKVGDGDVFVRFTKTPSMEGTWVVSNDIVRGSEVCTNGKVRCYAVSLDDFRRVDGV